MLSNRLIVRRQVLRLGVSGALVAAGVGEAVARSVGSGVQPTPWPKGKATPGLSFQDVDGRTWSQEQLAGKRVLLNFWASWCDPCRDEMPSLDQLAIAEGAQPLVVLTVNFREGLPAIQRFREQLLLDLPVVRDGNGQIARAWGVRAFPTTILVDGSGRARWMLEGEVTWTAPDVRRWLAV